MEKEALVAGGAAAPASSSCTVAESRYLRHVSAKESLQLSLSAARDHS